MQCKPMMLKYEALVYLSTFLVQKLYSSNNSRCMNLRLVYSVSTHEHEIQFEFLTLVVKRNYFSFEKVRLFKHYSKTFS